MLNNITIGQYFPGNSVLHRLDPRTKIAVLFFLIIAIFVFDQPVAYLVLTLLTFGCMVVSRVPMKTQIGSLKPLWWIILFTFLIHLFSADGRPLFHLWILTATWEGLVRGFFICLRLALLLLLSSLLTFTTSPLKLTDALEAILSPLKSIGVPAHELAMMMTIALRFVPTLIEETDKIMKAQQSRGADRRGLFDGQHPASPQKRRADSRATLYFCIPSCRRTRDGDGGALLSRRHRPHADEGTALCAARLYGLGRDGCADRRTHDRCHLVPERISLIHEKRTQRDDEGAPPQHRASGRL